MQLLLFLIVLALFGAAVGFLARLLVPGPDTMGFLATVALGIAGSFLGGFLASLLLEGELELRGSGLIGSILGAILILLLGRLLTPSTRRHAR